MAVGRVGNATAIPIPIVVIQRRNVLWSRPIVVMLRRIRVGMDMSGGCTRRVDAEDASSKVSKDKLQQVLREFELNDNVDMVQPPRHLSSSPLV